MNVKDLPAEHLIDRLIDGLNESEQRFFHAAEHVRNRGLKLVLKTYIRQRAQFARELGDVLHPGGYERSPADSSPSFGQGLSDIQATMVVRREDRQHLVLSQIADADEALVKAYSDALAEPLPGALHSLLQRQLDELRRVQRRLRLLAEESGNRRILVRLFNDAHKAEAVVNQLQRAGFDEDAIYTTSVENISLDPAEPVQRRRSMRGTVTTSAIMGAVVGLILGGLLAFGHRLYFPEVPGLISSTPQGVTFELLAGGALIGALFGTIFGLLMGRDAAEDDAYLTYESLRDGDTLVAVTTDSANAAQAERIVGLRHEFEVEPSTA
jgi:hypothetical protein